MYYAVCTLLRVYTENTRINKQYLTIYSYNMCNCVYINNIIQKNKKNIYILFCHLNKEKGILLKFCNIQ